MLTALRPPALPPNPTVTVMTGRLAGTSSARAVSGCGAPAGGVSADAAVGSQAVVEGKVTREGAAVSTGYARLLGTGDEFVAEVPLGTEAASASSRRPARGRCACWPRAACAPSVRCRPITAG